MLQLTVNPGLTLTGFRTTRPWCFVYDERAMCGFVCLNEWVFLRGRKGR